jgi:hypothetical protein
VTKLNQSLNNKAILIAGMTGREREKMLNSLNDSRLDIGEQMKVSKDFQSFLVALFYVVFVLTTSFVSTKIQEAQIPQQKQIQNTKS